MGQAVTVFFLFLFITIIAVGGWLYLQGEVEFFFDEERCSELQTYEEYSEGEEGFEGDYTKSYGERIREVLHGCF